MPDSLSGKTVLITGAAKRIGRAIALEAAERGARTAIHYRSSKRDAERTASETGGMLVQADLGRVSEIRRMFAEIAEAFDGRLDALVNNAGVHFRTPLLETTEEQWDAIQSSNLKACFFCCQEAAKLMRERGSGRIVNLSSLGGVRPWSGYAPYNASKAGVIHMTRALAKELAPAIQVNTVAPGLIEFDEPLPPDLQRIADATPMRRHGEGRDVAEAVLYFLTCSTYVTGQMLAVDGGLMSHTGAGGPRD